MGAPGTTPGRWAVVTARLGSGPAESIIGFVGATGPVATAEEYAGCAWLAVKSADAHQIAASPDLYDALRGLAANAGALRAFEHEIRYDVGNTNWQCLMDAVAVADAALAKAEGRS